MSEVVIYISGPITGMPDRNKAAFRKTCTEIRRYFYGQNSTNQGVGKNHGLRVKIINPVKIGMRLDREFAKRSKTPDWSDYMRVCLKELCNATFLYSLDGWASSEGATIERHCAKRLDIPCTDDFDELRTLVTKHINQKLYENGGGT